jgi:hypothetical protein
VTITPPTAQYPWKERNERIGNTVAVDVGKLEEQTCVYPEFYGTDTLGHFNAPHSGKVTPGCPSLRHQSMN